MGEQYFFLHLKALHKLSWPLVNSWDYRTWETALSQDAWFWLVLPSPPPLVSFTIFSPWGNSWKCDNIENSFLSLLLRSVLLHIWTSSLEHSSRSSMDYWRQVCSKSSLQKWVGETVYINPKGCLGRRLKHCWKDAWDSLNVWLNICKRTHYIFCLFLIQSFILYSSLAWNSLWSPNQF